MPTCLQKTGDEGIVKPRLCYVVLWVCSVKLRGWRRRTARGERAEGDDDGDALQVTSQGVRRVSIAFDVTRERDARQFGLLE